MTETINHPPHYGGADDPYETIKVLEAWLTPEQLVGFLRGNALKYLSRAGKKGDAATDYGKAEWYAARLAERHPVERQAIHYPPAVEKAVQRIEGAKIKRRRQA